MFHADVIIGADGVKSAVQKAVTGLDNTPMPTGDPAYHAIIPTDLMLKDPDLRQLVETPFNPRDDCVDGLQQSECHLCFSIVLAASRSENLITWI